MKSDCGEEPNAGGGQYVEAREGATVHAPFQVHGDYVAVQHLYVPSTSGAAGGCGRPGLTVGAAGLLEDLLVGFDPPMVLEGLLARIRRRRWVTVHGPAGSGKSVLLSALACPARSVGLVPQGVVQALAYLDATTTAVSLSQELSVQLQGTVAGFTAAMRTHQQMAGADWFEQDSFSRDLYGPLAHLSGEPVCLVLDGLDQLQGGAAEEVRQALLAVWQDPALEHVRLVASVRQVEDWLPDGGLLTVPEPATRVLSRYLQSRRVAPESAELLAGLCARGDGAWLLARLIGDAHQDLDESGRLQLMHQLLGVVPGSALSVLYEQLLTAAGAGEPEAWAERYRPVLTSLAAAGVGPVVPLPLIAAVSAHFGGPQTAAEVRQVLSELSRQRLVVRASVGTDAELVGLFHPTLVEHLVEHASRRVDVVQGKRILIDEVEHLAPVTGMYMNNPLYRWAAESEAEHMWQFGLISRSLASLWRRPLPTPRQNQQRWVRWYERILAVRGPDHPDTLDSRYAISLFTGHCEEWAEGLRLSSELLPDQVRVLGPLHPSTLATRNNIASWMGYLDEGEEALRLFRELLLDHVRVLGPLHPQTLNTRNNVAVWTGQVIGAGEALRLFRELLPDRVRKLGPLNPSTLTTRFNIASSTGEVGEAREAVRLLLALLPDQSRVLGPLHADTLYTRHAIASWTGSFNSGEALRLFRELLPDYERVLGLLHPGTLSTRDNIALLTAESGDA